MRGNAFGNDQTSGGKVERAHLIVSFFNGGEEFIAQAQIQRKFWSDTPVVLPEEGINLVVIVNVVQIINTAAIAQADQKRRKAGSTSEGRGWIISEPRTKVEGAARRRRLKNSELFTANVGTKFERVIAAHPTEIFRNAVGVLHFVRRQKRGTANLLDIAEGKLGQSAIAGHIRNSGEATGEIQ